MEHLLRKGCVRSPRVEAAFRAVDRRRFVPAASAGEAYADRVIVLKQAGGALLSSLSQPAMVAIMLEQLAPEPGQRVLEIGTGSGYNAALLAHLVGAGGRVVSLDLEADLVARARGRLAAAGVRGVELRCADGVWGHAALAPYDRLIVTAAAADLPPPWWVQLCPDGRLVLPLEVRDGLQAAVAFQRFGVSMASDSVYPCLFMGLRGAGGAAAPAGGGVDWQGAALPPPARRAALLAAPIHDLPSGVRVADWDAGGVHGLRGWLAIHLSELVGVAAEPDSAHAARLPTLEALPDRRVLSEGLLTADGLALIGRRAAAGAPRDAGAVYVRGYGRAGALQDRLVGQVRAWHAAGRPGLEAFGIEARLGGAGPAPLPGLRRRWTRFAFVRRAA